MRIEITVDDAVLQHAGEHDALASRPDTATLAANGMTADGTTATAARRAARGDDPAIDQRYGERHDREAGQDREGGAVGRPRKGGEGGLTPGAHCQTASTDAFRPAKMSVSRMPAIHGSVVVTARSTTITNKVHGRSPKDGSLQCDHWPEIERPARRNEQPVDHRAARHEVALEPARQIPAGVVLAEREAVPQRWRKQRQRGDPRRGADGKSHGARSPATRDEILDPTGVWEASVRLVIRPGVAAGEAN